jgi:hypothetical protein
LRAKSWILDLPVLNNAARRLTWRDGVRRNGMMTEQEDEASEREKDFAALDIMSKARLDFERRICEASASQSEDVLEMLRLEKMFEYAQFFFTIAVMGLNGPDDAALLADFHNEHLDKLLKDEAGLKRRGLSRDRVLWAIFTADTKPRLELIWDERPGSLDQSNLARFLVGQMSSETAREITVACEAAGFVTRRRHGSGATVVRTTGVMERVMSESLRQMRLAIKNL